MCGIYGYLRLDERDRWVSDDALLSRMSDSMQHRGPDDGGHFVDAVVGVGMGMCRLSIIDLAGGHQPVTNEDGTIWLVYNGELYNYRDLMTELKARGHVFKTVSDTEVVVHAYEEWGFDCVRRFNGMFAFALCDSRQGLLFLARDHLGIKPLYYYEDGKRLLFASEIKAILADTTIPRRLDWPGLSNYITFGHAVGPVTMYRGIRKLLPGYRLVAQGGRIDLTRYWDPLELPQEQVQVPRSYGEALAQVRWLLRDAVERQLMADVPLGAFLSGGLDSSTVVALMSQSRRGAVCTFSAGYEGLPGHGELDDARVVARHFGTQHYELVLRRRDIVEAFERVVCHLDEPFGDAAVLPAYLLACLARQHVKVVLTGEGGDELFGGYQRYVGERLGQWYRLLPAPIAARFLPDLLQVVGRERAARLLKTYAIRDSSGRHASQLSVTDPTSRFRLLSTEAQQAVQQWEPEAIYRHKHEQASARCDPLNAVLYTDMLTWLPDTYLEKIDKATMAHSVEGRVPLLDVRLVEMMVRVPSSWKVSWGQTKRLFRQAVAEWLPPAVLYRPKQGFGPWLSTWFGAELRALGQRVLHEAFAGRNGVLDKHYCAEMLQRTSQDPKASTLLWQILVLQTWLQRSGVEID
jgi:asparagine synthase (glutamine-hydrolysing)